MMKMTKSIIMIYLMLLICCSYSFGQEPIGIGVRGLTSSVVPVTIGMIGGGAGTFPVSAGGISNANVYLGGTRPSLNITHNEFVCNSMSACGMYPNGLADNSDGAMVDIGGVRSGATVPLAKL